MESIPEASMKRNAELKENGFVLTGIEFLGVDAGPSQVVAETGHQVVDVDATSRSLVRIDDSLLRSIVLGAEAQ